MRDYTYSKCTPKKKALQQLVEKYFFLVFPFNTHKSLQAKRIQKCKIQYLILYSISFLAFVVPQAYRICNGPAIQPFDYNKFTRLIIIPHHSVLIITRLDENLNLHSKKLVSYQDSFKHLALFISDLPGIPILGNELRAH